MNGWTRTTGAALAAGALTIGSAGTSTAAPAEEAAEATTRPNITVTIDNGVDELVRGDTVEYTITVRNEEDTAFPEALVAQMLPAGLAYEEVSPAADKSRDEEIVWIGELPAHGEAKFHLTGTVGELAEGRTELSTTACVLPDGETRPAFCASDTDPVYPPANSSVWLLFLALPLIAATVFGWFWYRKRRRNAPVAAEDEKEKVSASVS